MKFVKLNSAAILPSRATRGSAGYDLYALEAARILVGETVTIPTGITVEGMPEDLCGQIFGRSGMARKQGIDRMAGLIDSDYEHDIGVVLINHGDIEVFINVGDRVGQIIFSDIYLVENDRVIKEERTGGFGSTGN